MFLSFSMCTHQGKTMRGHRKGGQKESPYQKLNRLQVLDLGLPSLQTEKYMSVV